MTTEPRTHHARVRLVRRESPGQTTHTTFTTHKATHGHARQVEKCRSNHARGHARTAHRLSTHAGGFTYTPRAWWWSTMSRPASGRALDELWTRDEVGQRNSEMRLLATHASIAPRNPQHPAHTREPALP
jgi:hypothetical protein